MKETPPATPEVSHLLFKRNCYSDFYHQRFGLSLWGLYINELILNVMVYVYFFCSIFYLWDATMSMHVAFLFQYYYVVFL